MTRREFALAAAFQPSPPALRDARYQHIKGFNYVPSYAASIWEVIDHFDAKVWDREFGYAKRFHANAMRVWCDYLSFQKDEKHFLKSWETALALAVKHGYQIMVTTANRWTDPVWSFGQLDLAFIVGGAPSSEFLRYLKTFAGAFRNHPAVLMWDLCNEPYFYPGVRAATAAEKTFLEQLMTRETAYWAKAIETVRSAAASQPVTLGVMRNAPEESLRMVDVISCHPYPGWWAGATEFQSTCDWYVEAANRLGKPLIASETCQGSKNNQTRTQIIRNSIRSLEHRKIGWLAWQLMAGKIVTARWDRTDHNCKPGDESVMYWVETDGRTRPGHDESQWRDW